MVCEHCKGECYYGNGNPWIDTVYGTYHTSCLKEAIAKPKTCIDELRAFHDRVFLAALSELCANQQISSKETAIAEARATAIEAVRQHAVIMAERDAAIADALKGGE